MKVGMQGLLVSLKAGAHISTSNTLKRMVVA